MTWKPWSEDRGQNTFKGSAPTRGKHLGHIPQHSQTETKRWGGPQVVAQDPASFYSFAYSHPGARVTPVMAVS